MSRRGGARCKQRTSSRPTRPEWTRRSHQPGALLAFANVPTRIPRSRSAHGAERDVERPARRVRSRRPDRREVDTMTRSELQPGRSVLPIPDGPYPGRITYDASDPESSFPPIEPLRPLGRAECDHCTDRRLRVRSLVGLRRAMHDTDRRAPGAGRPEVFAFPHDCAVFADSSGPDDRPEPPLGRDGRSHRDGDLSAWLQLDTPEQRGAAC